MDLDFTEEQMMLKTMIRDFLAQECPKTLVRELEESDLGYSPEIWKKMEELVKIMPKVVESQEGETWWCKGTVTKAYAEGNEHCVDCDIWAENGKGEKTTTGSATVVLPSRG